MTIIEVFDNDITGNDSAAVIIVSYYIVDVEEDKPSYDPVPEKIYVHDNRLSGNATAPQGLATTIAALFSDDTSVDPPKTMVDMFYDSAGVGTGFENLLLSFPEGFSEDQRICMQNNGAGTTFGTVNGALLFGVGDFRLGEDLSPYDCSHEPLEEVVLEEVFISDDSVGDIETEALCNAAGDSVNADAYVADCPNLSSYRLFSKATDPTANPNGQGLIYDLTTALFSDYTEKYRFVFLPEGETASYSDTEAFDFPVGTIISKTFTMPADLRDANSTEEIIETRLLIRRSNGWVALPYIWNEDKSEAVLTKIGGTHTISWIDSNGEEQSTNYAIPNANQCANCHGEDAMLPLGPKARLLNKSYAYTSGTENQIAHWTAQGLLAGAPSDTSSINTIPLWGDTSADLNDRARGYLEVNCAHCHSANAAANSSGLLLEYNREFSIDVGECKEPVAAGDGAGDLAFAIVPGNADESIMTFRMNSLEPDISMPELGRSVLHTEGIDLIEQWINAMPADDCN